MSSDSGATVYCSGVNFPDTQAASGDVNTLDDYEEGTWTPNAHGFSGTETIQYAVYTKIGRLVHVSFQMTTDNTDDTSHFIITQLPFTVGSASTGSIQHSGNYSGEDGMIGVHFAASTTQIALYESDASDITYNAMSFNASGKYVRISGTYNV